MNDETFTSKQRAKMQEDASTREAFNVYTDDEVIGAIQNALGTYAKKMRIIFWFIAYIPFEIQICTIRILKAYILAFSKMIQED